MGQWVWIEVERETKVRRMVFGRRLKITGISVRGNSSLGYGGLKFEHENYTQFEVQETIGSKGNE